MAISILSMGFLSVGFLLSACGGGSSSHNNNSSQSLQQNSSVALSSIVASSSATSVTQSSSVASSVSNVMVKISGTVTYDFVPHNLNHVGLNYLAITQKPVRAATVELLDAFDVIQYSGTTSELGAYEFTVPANTLLKVRVKARSVHTSAPTWNFSVTDNTNSDAIYSMVGNLISSGTTDSVRDLNASSGWDTVSSKYTDTRAAAPFAILDTIYTGSQRVQTFGISKNFPNLKLHWSAKNKAADGNISDGDISTTYFQASDIYILGDADNDTDEYDPSPLLHEFGHYIQQNFFRDDSPGGSHAEGESLDMRLAFSEGFANAFSGMMLANNYYEDTMGTAQANGGYFNLAKTNWTNKGYYDEGSVESILYNYFAASGTNKTAMDASLIFAVMGHSNFTNAASFISLFTFYDQLKAQYSDQATLVTPLMVGQNTNGTDQFATGETNSSGLQSSLPVYKIINADNQVVTVCSSPRFGKFNKLGNSAFLKLVTTQTKSYNIQVVKNLALSDPVTSKPEFYVYNRGALLSIASNNANDSNSKTVNLSVDTYLIEAYEVNNHDDKNTDNSTLCFDVRVQ